MQERKVGRLSCDYSTTMFVALFGESEGLITSISTSWKPEVMSIT